MARAGFHAKRRKRKPRKRGGKAMSAKVRRDVEVRNRQWRCKHVTHAPMCCRVQFPGLTSPRWLAMASCRGDSNQTLCPRVPEHALCTRCAAHGISRALAEGVIKQGYASVKCVSLAAHPEGGLALQMQSFVSLAGDAASLEVPTQGCGWGKTPRCASGHGVDVCAS